MITLVLMVYFKLSQTGFDTFQSTSKNLIADYAKNLSPLFTKSEITNEDVFNFALYKELPVDKENKKLLKIESDNYGNDKFEVIENSELNQTKNYEVFKEKLELTPGQIPICQELGGA